MQRFWFEFAVEDPRSLPAGTRMGCGVTANSEEEALDFLKERVFKGQPLPAIGKKVLDVDVETLDANHVRPNMGNPATRGVWFPLG